MLYIKFDPLYFFHFSQRMGNTEKTPEDYTVIHSFHSQDWVNKEALPYC